MLPLTSPESPLRLRPEIGELDVLVGFIEQFGQRHGWPAADTHAFSLAAEELFVNTLRHSQPAASLIEFSIVNDEQGVTAHYSDDGGEFDPTLIPEVDTTLPVEQRRIGGLGIHFIRRTMQTFSYRRDGGRNIVQFGRALASPTEVQRTSA
jgi:anti-sigma regulatory factor (Ser/Thr protein kinase)